MGYDTIKLILPPMKIEKTKTGWLVNGMEHGFHIEFSGDFLLYSKRYFVNGRRIRYIYSDGSIFNCRNGHQINYGRNAISYIETRRMNVKVGICYN